MGALSSWAMLALTHHFIVQFCAYKVAGRARWFTAYAVLGDDIVIGDAKVAKAYLHTMATLGVGIGLHKSLISGQGTTLEFAKRTIHLGKDVSPVPLTEFKAAMVAPATAVQFIRTYSLTLAAFLKAAGYGYRVLGTLHKPIGQLNSKVRLIILAMNIPLDAGAVRDFFSIGLPKGRKAIFETAEVIKTLVSQEYTKLANSIYEISRSLAGLGRPLTVARDIAGALLPRLQNPVKPSMRVYALARIASAFCTRNDRGLKLLLSPTIMEELGEDAPLFEYECNYLITEAQRAPSFEVFADHFVKVMLDAYERAHRDIIENFLDNADILFEEDVDLALEESHGDFPFQFTPVRKEGVSHKEYVRTLQATLERSDQLGHLMPLIKLLQLQTQRTSRVRALELIDRIIADLRETEKSKDFGELYTGLLRLSDEVSLIPVNNLSYRRVVDAATRGFSDGTHIRLWKSLSGLVQGTRTTAAPTRGVRPIRVQNVKRTDGPKDIH